MTLRYSLFESNISEPDYAGEIKKLIQLDLKTNSTLLVTERYEAGLKVLSAYENKDPEMFMQAVAQMKEFYEKCKC
jgi:hypothetical protein